MCPAKPNLSRPLAIVPSIIVYNGSPASSPAETRGIDSSDSSRKSSDHDSYGYMMSLGDETAVSQHGPAMNTMTASQRPVNCSVSPPMHPPKQSTLTCPAGGNRNVGKPVPLNRVKVERSLSKQDGFDIEEGSSSTVQRLRSNTKVKVLQRSHAMREETSPPRESEVSHFASTNTNNNDKLNIHKTINGINTGNGNKASSLSSKSGYQGGNSLQVNNNINRPNSRHKLRHQGSSQGSADSSSPCLSRDSSTEQYTDNSGIDLSQFIADTINKNNKDRMFLLQVEQDLLSLQKDPKRAYQKFPVMASYQRMLVHRVAAFFGMDHNVDPTGNCVIVNVTPSTRIPDIRFSDLIRGDVRFSEEPRRCILKRDSNSFEEGTQLRSPERQLSGDSRRSKSFEEREEEYERARKRIFNRDDSMTINASYRSRDTNSRRNSHEDLRWQGGSQPWSSSDSDLCSSKIRPHSSSRASRIAKVESFEGHDTLKAHSLKGSVPKSYSFGGYPESMTGSGCSARLSPSSSAYKSSARTDSAVLNAPPSNQAPSQCSLSTEPNTVLWAVSSISAVPPGAVLINPASGQPYTNPDGSLYRYDPDNPLKLCADSDATNKKSSPVSGGIASIVHVSEVANPDKSPNLEASSKVTYSKPGINLRNSSTSPSLPDIPAAKQDSGSETADSSDSRQESFKSIQSQSSNNNNGIRNDKSAALHNNNHHHHHDNNSNNNNNDDDTDVDKDDGNNNNNNNNSVNNNNVNNNRSSNSISYNGGNSNSNNVSHNKESMPAEVAQTNFNSKEGDSINFEGNENSRACQNEGKEFQGRSGSNPVPYQVNFSSNSQGEYGSQPVNNGTYLNSTLGMTSISYTVGPQYTGEPLHMPPEATTMYSHQVLYAGGSQSNPYGVVQTAANAPTQNYEARPNDANPGMNVPELGNYFMGLNVNSEQAPPPTTPAPHLGYWAPSPNASQTQGSNHSSQIQVYYLPGSVSAGAIHPKYTPAAPSMYTYNVPPMVYPTEICQSVIPGGAANTVFPAPYYPPAPNANLSYRTPTPPTPTAVAATAVAPASFFVYHPQPPAPPPPPTVQFGMVRPQQQVPAIRSSPPSGPRTGRMPHGRSASERTRHSSLDHKGHGLHFSSPLSIYGLRFMSGEFQSLGMVRGSSRGFGPNSSHSQYQSGSQASGSENTNAASRPPKPRKQR